MALTTSLLQFATRFVNELEKGKSQVCSPLSAQAVLALTALGSGGDTRKELLQAMALSDDEALRSLFSYVTTSTKSIEGISLKMANKVYVTDKGTLKPAIQKDVDEVFQSGLEQLDFVESAAAAGVVNKWVAEQTENMIKEVVNANSLDSETCLLLVNAIYFQGLWERPFLKSQTGEGLFHVNDTTTIKVPMMCQRDVNFLHRHSPVLKAQLLEMYYTGRQASMVVIRPDAIDGLGAVLQQLAAGQDLLAELADMRRTLLDVYVPKFKIETEIDLKKLLPEMGIKHIFDAQKSDIRMLSSNERLHVYQAIQKAVIEVDEAGTRAAACTSIGLVKRSAHKPTKLKFIANRPFLYLLRVRQIPVFLGVYQGTEFRCTGQLSA